jgi:hypothetical protein
MINREALQDEYIEHVIDGLDIKTMAAIIYETLTESYSDLGDADFITLVQEHAPHLIEGETE